MLMVYFVYRLDESISEQANFGIVVGRSKYQQGNKDAFENSKM